MIVSLIISSPFLFWLIIKGPQSALPPTGTVIVIFWAHLFVTYFVVNAILRRLDEAWPPTPDDRKRVLLGRQGTRRPHKLAWLPEHGVVLGAHRDLPFTTRPVACRGAQGTSRTASFHCRDIGVGAHGVVWLRVKISQLLVCRVVSMGRRNTFPKFTRKSLKT